MSRYTEYVPDTEADFDRPVYAEDMTELVVDMLSNMLHHGEAINLRIQDSGRFNNLSLLPDSLPKIEIWFDTFENVPYEQKNTGYTDVTYEDFRSFFKMVNESEDWESSFDLTIGGFYKPWSPEDK